MRRNINKSNSYKEKYGYSCMNPDCKSGLFPQVHHIVPLKNNGLDDYDNFIILCKDCHINFKRHSQYEKQEIMLATFKYYAEGIYGEKQDIAPEVATMPLESTTDIIEENPRAYTPRSFKPPKKKKERHTLKQSRPKRHKKAKKRVKEHIIKISVPNGRRKIRRGFHISALKRIL